MSETEGLIVQRACPFCGGRRVRRQSIPAAHEIAAMCVGCKACGPRVSMFVKGAGNADTNAIDAWEQRRGEIGEPA